MQINNSFGGDGQPDFDDIRRLNMLFEEPEIQVGAEVADDDPHVNANSAVGG